MAKSSCRVVLFGAPALSRRLCTPSATTDGIKAKDGSLYRRLLALGGGDANAADAINEWLKEGRSIEQRDIIRCIYRLRSDEKYKLAIQMLEWVEKSGREVTNSDHAVRIDLLLKTKGMASAEQYFNNLPESAKEKHTYGALLNCYCKSNMYKKSMELFDKMREQGFATNALSYNNLMTLHQRMGKPEKVPQVAQEMEEKNIPLDLYSYNHLISSYGSMNDIKGVEGVMEKMKENGIKCDYATYGNLASIYVKAGLFDEANAALKEIESMDNLRGRTAYHVVITLYSRTSNSLGVNRVWKSLKAAYPKTTNISYLVMLLAFSRLGDVDGLKKYFEEWESSCSIYDVRLVNVLMDSYLSRDMIKEAELLYEATIKRGAGPNMRTLEMFMEYYLKKRQIDLALNYMDTAAAKEKAKKKSWKPSHNTVSLFMKYFEEQKDVEGAERFFKGLKVVECLNYKVYDALLHTYIAAGKVEPQMRHRLKEDGIRINSETEKLLQKVCLN